MRQMEKNDLRERIIAILIPYFGKGIRGIIMGMFQANESIDLLETAQVMLEKLIGSKKAEELLKEV